MGIRATMLIGDYTVKTYSDGDLFIEHDGANEIILGFHEAHALAHFILANLREASVASSDETCTFILDSLAHLPDVTSEDK